MSKLMTSKDNKKEESVRCHHNCFECKFDDCINDVLTSTEKAESKLRDINYMGYGKVMIQKPTRRKHRNRR